MNEFFCCGIYLIKSLVNEDVAPLPVYPFFFDGFLFGEFIALLLGGPGVQRQFLEIELLNDDFLP
jgi:hypothetical protein